MERTVDTKFYTFNQNNSGGSFHKDHTVGIGQRVIIQATDEDDAIFRAEKIGLYFDGGGDCPCCGNRWSSYVEGEDYPNVYGTKMTNCNEKTHTFIHYFDGSFSFAKEDVESDQ